MEERPRRVAAKRKTEESNSSQDLYGAFQLVLEKKTRIEDLAERFGMSHATLYRRFGQFKQEQGSSPMPSTSTAAVVIESQPQNVKRRKIVKPTESQNGKPKRPSRGPKGDIGVLSLLEEQIMEETLMALIAKGCKITVNDVKRMCYLHLLPNIQFPEKRTQMVGQPWYDDYITRHGTLVKHLAPPSPPGSSDEETSEDEEPQMPILERQVPFEAEEIDETSSSEDDDEPETPQRMSKSRKPRREMPKLEREVPVATEDIDKTSSEEEDEDEEYQEYEASTEEPGIAEADADREDSDEAEDDENDEEEDEENEIENEQTEINETIEPELEQQPTTENAEGADESEEEEEDADSEGTDGLGDSEVEEEEVLQLKPLFVVLERIASQEKPTTENAEGEDESEEEEEDANSEGTDGLGDSEVEEEEVLQLKPLCVVLERIDSQLMALQNAATDTQQIAPDEDEEGEEEEDEEDGDDEGSDEEIEVITLSD